MSGSGSNGHNVVQREGVSTGRKKYVKNDISTFFIIIKKILLSWRGMVKQHFAQKTGILMYAPVQSLHNTYYVVIVYGPVHLYFSDQI